MDRVVLKSIEQVDREEWNSYIIIGSKNPSQLYQYALTRSKSIPIFIEIYRDEKVIFRWLMFYHGIKNFGYIEILSEPFPQIEEYMEKGINEVIKILKPFEIHFFCKTLSKCTSKSFFERMAFDQIYEYGSYILDVTKSEEELFNQVDAKHRNRIKRAYRNSINIKENTSEEGVLKFYELTEATYRRSNKEGPSLEYLLNTYRYLYKSGNCRLFFAYYFGEAQAAVFIITSSKMVICLHAASKDNLEAGASNLLHWEIIKEMKQEGIELYDFGGVQKNPVEGSKAYSLKSYKRKFGGRYYEFYGGTRILNRFKSHIYEVIRHIKGYGEYLHAFLKIIYLPVNQCRIKFFI